MKHLLLALPLAFAGCHAKHEATSGKEFYAKLRSAMLEKDVDTLWKMTSQEVRTSFVQQAKGRIQTMRTREDINANLPDDSDPLPVDDLPTDDPEALAKILLGQWMESNRGLVERMEFVETVKTATPMGECVSVVVRYPGVDRDTLLLMEVDGYLKLFSPGRILQVWEASGASVPRCFGASQVENLPLRNSSEVPTRLRRHRRNS